MFKALLASIAMICAVFTSPLAFAQSSDNAAEVKRPAQFLIQDNEFRYEFSSWYRDPFIENSNYKQSGAFVTCSQGQYLCPAKNLPKNVVGFTHVDLGNKLGDNVLDVQLMMDNKSNPVSVGYYHDSTNVGSKDFYVTFRHDIVIDRIVNKDLGIGPIKNWVLEVGADLSEKNDDFGNQRRSPMIGPGVNFKVPNGGYWKVVAMWTREWNNEGTDVTSFYYTNDSTGAIAIDAPAGACPAGNPYCQIPSPRTWGQKVVYSPREVTIQTGWGLPFALGKTPWIFEGWSTLNTAKGYGAPQLVPFTGPGFYSPVVYYKQGTRPESYSHARVMYNFGSLFGKGHLWQIGVGYEYWHNEFGVPQEPPISTVPNATYQCNSCIGNTPFLSLAIHL